MASRILMPKYQWIEDLIAPVCFYVGAFCAVMDGRIGLTIVILLGAIIPTWRLVNTLRGRPARGRFF